MEPIFDRHGETVAWRHRDFIYDPKGKARALVRQRTVFTFQGKFLGRFEDGFYRDPQARAVAFEEGATGGPMQPVLKVRPLPPPPKDLPYPPTIEDVPPPPRFRANAWSDISWDDFLRGKTPASA
jgi:hypothetical protein